MNRIDHTKTGFAKTNIETIQQRAKIINEFFPKGVSIGEICCGDCSRQFELYNIELQLRSYTGLDIDNEIVKSNTEKGIACLNGDAMDKTSMKHFLSCDILFYGPPLSDNCDGHNILDFENVKPSFYDFLLLLYKELDFQGIIACITARNTTLGSITKLYKAVRKKERQLNIPLIHYSYSSITGSDKVHPSRLKYIDVWFSKIYDDKWEVRHVGN